MEAKIRTVSVMAVGGLFFLIGGRKVTREVSIEHLSLSQWCQLLIFAQRGLYETDLLCHTYHVREYSKKCDRNLSIPVKIRQLEKVSEHHEAHTRLTQVQVLQSSILSELKHLPDVLSIVLLVSSLRLQYIFFDISDGVADPNHFKT